MTENETPATPETEQVETVETVPTPDAPETASTVVTGDEVWNLLTERLEGYIYVQTNAGPVRVNLRQTVQDEVDEDIKKHLKVPTPPKKKQKVKGSSEKLEVEDRQDPKYIKDVQEYGLMMTLIAIDHALIDKPAGELMARCTKYKGMSATTLGLIVAGIQSLNMQQLTQDMIDDEQAEYN